jgi:hypothetical protein
MKHIRILLFTPLWLFVITYTVKAQPANPQSAFDFLIGNWRVTEKQITGADTTLHGTSTYKIYKSHDGATIKDDWIYRSADTVMFRASMLRSYDAANKKWMLYYADSKFNSQVWEGRFENNEWWFYRERMRDGKKVIVKIKWVAPAKNRIQQYIYRSFDEGGTWVLGSILEYKKKT